MIYEEEKLKQSEFKKALDELMTEDEQKRVAYYIDKYTNGRNKLQDKLEEWEEIHKAYTGVRTDTINPEQDNIVAVNIMLAQIEGQVSSMMNNNPTTTVRGRGYSDQKFAKTASVVADFILNHNNPKYLIKDAARKYLKYGNAILTVIWDNDALDGFGMPVIEVAKNGTVIIDDKIDDIVNDLNRADYIIHQVGARSIAWAKERFGEDKANAIVLGNNQPDFEYQDTDNEESFTYLRVWTKNNEKRKLQLLEISLCGILLSESSPTSPYYTNVFNKYPFFVAGLYKDESDSYYFGDGKAILPMQKYINKLYDEILLAVKFSSQGRTFADPSSKINPVEFAESDPSKILFAKNPNQTIQTSRGVGINDVVLNLLSNIFDKVQEVTRFSSLMTGNDPGKTMTATQAGIQMQQGITGIDDKKSDLSKMFGDAVNYSIGLCMQFWNAAKAFRVADNDDEFEWVDTRQFKAIPELIPSSKEFINKFKAENPAAEETPKYMQLEVEDENGNKKGATKQLELDIIVNIGEGLPTNRVALYNIVLSLSQIILYDEETGQPRPLITFKQFRSMVEEYLGIALRDNDAEWQQMVEMQKQMQMEAMQQQQQTQRPINISPNIEGANLNGTSITGGVNNAIQRQP